MRQQSTGTGGSSSSHDDGDRHQGDGTPPSPRPPPHKHGGNRRPTKDGGSSRRGLRIFVGSANLGHALPDPTSLDAWLPRHGDARRVLHPDVRPSSVVDGVSREDWNGADARGKIEVVAVGVQEGVAGKNALTATGVTALFTGTNVKERRSFANALGKPIDAARTKVTEMIGTQAEVGGTKQLKAMVTNHMGEDYALMVEYQRGEMVLYLFVRNDLKPISSVAVLQAQNCGIGSVMANKGGIAALLTVGTTRLSFLSAHLAAGHGSKHYEERNSDMTEIIRGTYCPSLRSHHAFVFGDLNYRFSLPPLPNGTDAPQDEVTSVCRILIGAKDWARMAGHDELEKALREKRILFGFQTLPIRTSPTYRCERREGIHYDYKRIPSYTDRILWKSVEETPRAIEPLLYEPIPRFSTSDHKPVRGLFFLPNRPPLKLNPDKTTLHITLKGFKCKDLKPSANLLQGEVDTYLDFQLEPATLELKPNDKKRRGRTYTINSTDRPSWPREEVKFQIDVSSKEEIHGAYLYVKCMNENDILGDSLLGTAVIDLEHIIRTSLGVMEWKDDVDRHFLRSERDVGKLWMHMDIHWDKSSRRPRHRPRDARPSSSRRRPATRSKSRTKMSDSEKALLRYLRKLDLPNGLLHTLVRNHRSCVKRYWLLDNSSSMKKLDSHLAGDNFEMVKVSRWEELSECVSWHAEMSATCGLPTTFSFMNAPVSRMATQKFSICCSNHRDAAREMEEARRIMAAATPTSGRSPLIHCIDDFKKKMGQNSSHLNSSGKHVTLVICTQGLPKDKHGATTLAHLRKFNHTIYSLSKQPVKVVIRLCTDDEETTRSYNGLDSKLDNCECIDDWWGEALEVYLHNPWFCYGVGIHRMREAGLLWGLFDNLDERPLDLDEIHQFCTHFFIGEKGGSALPHPRDWKSFMDGLSELVKKEKLQWNPVKKRRTHWISLSKLESMYQPVRHRGKARKTRESSRPSEQQKEQHDEPHQPPSEKSSDGSPSTKNSTLEEVIKCWSYQAPNYQKMNALQDLLVSIPTTFPPVNEKVEPHDHFSKWKPISMEAFIESSGDELNELLKRAVRKAKLFLHPDKLPRDLTESQSFLFSAIWNVILESEQETLI